MKSRELLSVVLSLIMIFGVSAGSAYAQTDTEVNLEESLKVTVDDDTVEDEIDGTTTEVELEEGLEVTDDTIKEEDGDRDVDKDLRNKLDRYCELSDEDKRKYIAEHDKTAEKAEKMNRFCTLNETDKADFIAENIDEYKAYMKDKMRNGMTDKKHMDYDRLCALSESDRALEFDDSEKLDRISNWYLIESLIGVT